MNKNMQFIKICDPTLRDGSHAISHQFSATQIEHYLNAADDSGLFCLEVGHGNGIGASCYQIGKSKLTDKEMLQTARRCLKKTRLGVHVIPGFATMDKDIKPAINIGVDVFRVASHCTEADITQRHIEYLSTHNKEVYGVLMMSHMTSKEGLLASCIQMQSYGALGVILMDSAGAYLPNEVRERISFLTANLDIDIGFHAHNNLGLAMANTLAAIEAGASILDGTARGFGAGAGNCQLEILVAVLEKCNIHTGVDLLSILDQADIAEKHLMSALPFSKTMSILTGVKGLFSGFAKHIDKWSQRHQVDIKEVIIRLGELQVVAGQEDMILEVIKQIEAKNVVKTELPQK